MIPTLVIGDVVAASRLAYVDLGPSVRTAASAIGLDWFRSGPERGDVVIFKYPGPNPSFAGAYYVKRVVGLPGERVQVVGGLLRIDGSPVARELLGPADPEGRPLARGPRRPFFQRYMETLPDGRRHEIIEMSDDQSFDNTSVYTVPPGHYFMMGNSRDNAMDSRSEGGWFVPRGHLVARAELILMSFGGQTSVWRPWEWPGAFRVERFMKAVQ
jgi:signal peptidase I